MGKNPRFPGPGMIVRMKRRMRRMRKRRMRKMQTRI